MKNYFIIICSVFLILSCKQGDPKTKTIFVTDTTKVTDTVIFIRDSLAAKAFADSLPKGFYQGMYPCEGCEGKQEIIFFGDDNKYKMEEQLWGKSLKPNKTEGTWERKEGLIWIYSKGKTAAKFRFANDSLVAIENQGKKISTDESSRYVLGKAVAASDNPEWKKKAAEGIEFIAIGNEPFWNLEIDKEKFILFRLADWKKPLIVAIESPVQKKDTTVYTLKADNNTTLRVAVYPEFGSDGMSDFLYDQKVQVVYQNQVYRGSGLYLK